jgi:hypothetical protein
MRERTLSAILRIGLAIPWVGLACNLARPANPDLSLLATNPNTPIMENASHAAETPASAIGVPDLPVLAWPITIDEMLAACPTAEQIAEVDATISMRFESDPSSGELVCAKTAGSADLTRLQKNAYLAILAMKFIAFDAPLPWTDQSLYAWFTESIDAIRFRGDIGSHSCCGTPPTINIISSLHILYSDRWGAVGGLTSILVHEARHRFKAHACQGRDNTIAEMGAMGAEYEFNRWLAYHSNPDVLTTIDDGITDHYRQYARFNAYALEKSSFCAEPTPAHYPPALTPSTMAGKPFLTDRMARAYQSGVPIPTPLAPSEGATVKRQGVEFSWNPIHFPGGVTYNIEVDTLYGFVKDWRFWKAHVDDWKISGTTYILPLSFNYYDVKGRWRVWATSPTAGDGPKSEWSNFTIEQS